MAPLVCFNVRGSGRSAARPLLVLLVLLAAAASAGPAAAAGDSPYVPKKLSLSATSGAGGGSGPIDAQLGTVPSPAPETGCPKQPQGSGSLVGRLSGPDGRLADVCLADAPDGKALAIFGARSPGSWEGTVQVIGGDPPAGPIAVSLSVRQSWQLPLLVLVLGLVIAMLLPLMQGQMRQARVLAYRLRTQLDAVVLARDHTLTQLKALPCSDATGVDTLTRPGGGLLLDLAAAALSSGLRTALDAAEREPFVPPAGAHWTSFQTTCDAAIDHYQTLLDAGGQASAIAAAVIARFPELTRPSAGSWLGAPLAVKEHPVVGRADWEARVKAAETALGHVQSLASLWTRIAALKEDVEQHATELLAVASDEELKALTAAVAAAEQRRRGAAAVAEAPAAAAIASHVFIQEARRSATPAPRHRTATQLRAKVQQLDLLATLVGGAIVLLTGFSTLYLANATFGSTGDWVGLATWGFALGAGVNVARSLLPAPQLS